MSSAAAKQVTTKMSAAVASATAAAAEALAANAPKSVLSIPSIIRYGPIPLSELADQNGRTPGAAIRQVGPTRRIFLLDPNGHLTAEEMDGLAYRIKMLTKNTGLNSILCANSIEKDDVDTTIPSSVLEIDQETEPKSSSMDGLFNYQSSVTHLPNAACGYDPRAMHKFSKDEKRQTLNAMMRLAKAIKGGSPTAGQNDDHSSKIPFITVPHGITMDGGYALSMGSYVLATSDSRFKIMNPARGLSLDPIGLSYILPRLGWEFQQPSANYPVGVVLALTGFEANEGDMVETGLATHFMDSFGKLGSVERALANLAPYEQQNLLKEPTRKYGESVGGGAGSKNRFQGDINAKFRNVAVAGLLHSVSLYDAMGQEITSASDQATFLADEDPSLVLEGDRDPMFGDRESMLLNVAATFQDAFEKEKSVEGIMARMREYASAEANNEEEIEFVNAAKELLEGMEAQSPLALCATHKLVTVGKEPKETLDSCMKREMRVQLSLFEKEDFKNWAKSGAKEGEFQDWKHKSVKDVTKDEVAELFR